MPCTLQNLQPTVKGRITCLLRRLRHPQTSVNKYHHHEDQNGRLASRHPLPQSFTERSLGYWQRDLWPILSNLRLCEHV